MALFDQPCQQAHVHGCGAELEGEGAPAVVEADAVFVAEAEIDLFINFQHRDDDGGDEDHPCGHFFGAGLFLNVCQQDGRAYAQPEEQQVKPAVQGGGFHGRVKNP